MSSLFSRKRFAADPDFVTLPAYCVTGGDGDKLQAKRDAQLKWMKENGVRHLGGPAVKHDRRAPRPPAASIRNTKPPVERPGDAIVRDLASNEVRDSASNGVRDSASNGVRDSAGNGVRNWASNG
jgi:hypothetical protein